MNFSPTKTEFITFLADETTLASFGAGEEECFYCMDRLFVPGSKWCIWHSFSVRKYSKKPVEFASNIVRFSCDMVSLTHFWSELRSSPYQARIFIMPGSLCKILSWNMLVGLIICLIVNYLSSIIIWWTQSIFSSVVAVARWADIEPLKFFLPILNSAAKQCVLQVITFHVQILYNPS